MQSRLDVKRRVGGIRFSVMVCLIWRGDQAIRVRTGFVLDLDEGIKNSMRGEYKRFYHEIAEPLILMPPQTQLA